MICNIASDISTKATVWTVTNPSNGRFIPVSYTHLTLPTNREV